MAQRGRWSRFDSVEGRRKHGHTHPADAANSEALTRATKFIATLFLGRGRYDKREAPTLEAAQIAAKDLSALHQGGRKVFAFRGS